MLFHQLKIRVRAFIEIAVNPNKRALLFALIILSAGFPTFYPHSMPHDFLVAATSGGGSSGGESSIPVTSVSSRYSQEYGSFHVFGEIMNNLKRPVENITLDVTFFDSGNNVTGTASGQPYLSFLRPGERAAFDVAVHGNSASNLSNFSYYKLSRSWDEVIEPKEGLLKLDVRSISIDRCGYYHVAGTINNLGKEAANRVRVSAAFYNEQNQVVASSLTTLKDRIDPTKIAPFDFVIEKKVLPHFSYYSLNVQSQEYASVVPEKVVDETNHQSVSTSSIASKRMSIFTNSTTYGVDEDEIVIHGKIALTAAEREIDNPLVLIKVITATGQVLYLVTAPVSSDGSFVRPMEFQVDDSSHNQVFRVRAEFEGMIAENTFAIRDEDASTGAEESAGCIDVQDVAVSNLDAVTLDGSGGSGDVTDLLSGKQIVTGSDVMLTTVAENRLSRIQPLTVIFEVFDPRGLVVFIHVENITLDPNSTQHPEVSWRPSETGTFTIKSFAVSDLDNPVFISPVSPLAVNIVEESSR